MKHVAKLWFLVAGVWFILWLSAGDSPGSGSNAWMFVLACAFFTIGCSFVSRRR